MASSSLHVAIPTAIFQTHDFANHPGNTFTNLPTFLNEILHNPFDPKVGTRTEALSQAKDVSRQQCIYLLVTHSVQDYTQQVSQTGTAPDFIKIVDEISHTIWTNELTPTQQTLRHFAYKLLQRYLEQKSSLNLQSSSELSSLDLQSSSKPYSSLNLLQSSSEPYSSLNRSSELYSSLDEQVDIPFPLYNQCDFAHHPKDIFTNLQNFLNERLHNPFGPREDNSTHSDTQEQVPSHEGALLNQQYIYWLVTLSVQQYIKQALQTKTAPLCIKIVDKVPNMQSWDLCNPIQKQNLKSLSNILLRDYLIQNQKGFEDDVEVPTRLMQTQKGFEDDVEVPREQSSKKKSSCIVS